MTQEGIIQTILAGSNYNLSLFSAEEIATLQKKISTRTRKGKKTETPFVHCIVRGKEIQLKPEEVVRQLYAARLIEQYGYPKNAWLLSMLSLLAEKRKALILLFLIKTILVLPILSLN